MDIFKFNNPTNATKMEQGEIINGLKSKMWVERYRDAGEFTLVAKASSGLKDKLPVDSFISHINSTEVMIVENHEINDKKDAESEIIITGRSYETFLENRIVGSNRTSFPVSGLVTDYLLSSAETWSQAATLISDHTSTIFLTDDNNAISFLEVIMQYTGGAVAVARSIKRGTVYERLMELLLIDNLGIKTVRPGPWSLLAPGSPNTAMLIYQGFDKSSTIMFSFDTGEIESADYLWSNKSLKNAALISGKWVETTLIPPLNEYGRRFIFINATDIDEAFTSAPSGGDLISVNNQMHQRAVDVLAHQNRTALVKAEVSKSYTKVKYREDYDLGDFITFNGNYHEGHTMQITEYVEIEDENGESGYPTFTHADE